MTGLYKLAAAVAVTGISALTALRLSRIKKDLTTRVGLPQKIEIIRGQVRFHIPVTIYNYTGFRLAPKRVRIEAFYLNAEKSPVQLGISPQQPIDLDLIKNKEISAVFQVDINPTVLMGLQLDTPVTVRVKFDYLFFPVDIDTVIRLSTFFPSSLVNTLSSTLSSVLKKLGLGNPTPLSPAKGYLPTPTKISDLL